MRKQFTTKDGVNVTVSDFVIEKDMKFPEKWGERTTYFMGFLCRRASNPTPSSSVYKAWLTAYSDHHEYDGKELVLMWRADDNPRVIENVPEQVSLSRMMIPLEDPVDYFAEEIAMSILQEDDFHDSMFEYAISRIEFEKLASEWWW